MFDKLIAFSLRYRLLIIAFFIGIFVTGFYELRKMRIDVFPDLNKPTVTVLIESGGLAPDEVERLILIPLENSISGSYGLSRLSSNAAVGYGVVKAEFDWDVDLMQARQTVFEKMSTVELPEGITPQLAPVSSIMGEVMLVGLSGNEEVSPMELRELAEQVVRKRLLGVSGVASVSVIGGDEKQYHIVLDTIEMQARGVSFSDVKEALEAKGTNGNGGFLKTAYTERLVRVEGRSETVADLEKIVISQGQGAFPILLKDIAEVKIAPERLKRGEAGINGKKGVLLSIAKQPFADTLKLTQALDEAMAEIEQSLPKTVRLEKDVFRQSRFIQNAVNNIKEALTSGAILIAVILFLFLRSFKGTLIILLVIPSTFLMTALVFEFFQISINTMTLGGLAMALGSLIDDAIVDVANIYKRLKERKGKSVFEVVLEASKEVRTSVVFSTVLIFLVFIPLFALQGIEGKIFTPLAVAFILSMGLSTLVALTLTPVLSYYLLPSVKSLGYGKDPMIVRVLKYLHRKILGAFLKIPKTVFVAVVGICAYSFFFLSQTGQEFLPPFNEGSFNISVASAPGTNLEESNRIGQKAEEILLSIPDVVSTGRKLGRSELDEHALGININEIEVRLKEPLSKTKEELMREIREKLALPGVFINIGQPISHRIDLIISGVQSQMVVKVFGSDKNNLNKVTNQIEKIMKEQQGLVDVQQGMQIEIPEVQVAFDEEKASRHGVRIGEAVQITEAVMTGIPVGEILEKEFSRPIILSFRQTDDEEELKKLLLPTIQGTFVPLSLVAEIHHKKSPNEIVRENNAGRKVITANLSSREGSKIAKHLQERIEKEVSFENGTYFQIDGQFKSSGTRDMIFLSVLSFLLMLGALYVNFKSMHIAVQLMISLPLALIGGVLGLWVTTPVISVATIIGFVALVGIAIRNGILLYDLYIAEEEKTGKKLTKEKLIHLTGERLEPVFMTMLTSVIGFLPLIAEGNTTGKEILYPMAVVIAFGLLITTVLNMFLTPIIFHLFHKKEKSE